MLLLHGLRRTRVRDRGLDLEAVANDARIGEQPLDVVRPKRATASDVEAGEGARR